jgi:hypothetical protein
LEVSTQSAFGPDHLPNTTEDVQQHLPAEFTGSSRRELSPFSKDYLHSLPSEDYALPNPKTVVLEKLNRQRAQNSSDSANYTLADITPVVTDLLLTRHLTSDDFFRTRRGKERAAPPYPSSTQSSGPTRGARPLLAEHQAVMAQLPKTLNRSYRSKISQFLCHLEQQGLRWHLLQEKNAQQRWRLRSIRPLRAMDLTQARARQLTGASS